MIESVDETLLCPRCRTNLAVSEGAKRCTTCGRSFPVIDGIADLLGDHCDVESDYVESPTAPRWSIAEVYVERFFALLRTIVVREAERRGRRLDCLDIGSGGLLRGTDGHGGRFYRILLDYSRSYIGIEPSWAMLRQVAGAEGNAMRLPHALLVRSCGEDLPVRAGTVDVVFCLSVLDHCINAATVVARAQEALRPGGLFILFLQNDGSWYREIVRRLLPAYFKRRQEEDHHHHRFQPTEAGELFCALGFEEVQVVDHAYLVAPGVAWLATALMRPLRRVSTMTAVNVAAGIDRRLSTIAPGRGSTFVLTARRP